MTDPVVSGVLIVTGIIHLVPVVGLVSAQRVGALYDIPVEEPNLEILMRHRAVLFGLLGAFLVWTGFEPDLRPAGFVAGFVSMASFLWLAHSVGGYNAALRRVFVADLAALALLSVGAILEAVQRL